MPVAFACLPIWVNGDAVQALRQARLDPGQGQRQPFRLRLMRNRPLGRYRYADHELRGKTAQGLLAPPRLIACPVHVITREYQTGVVGHQRQLIDELRRAPEIPRRPMMLNDRIGHERRRLVEPQGMRRGGKQRARRQRLAYGGQCLQKAGVAIGNQLRIEMHAVKTELVNRKAAEVSDSAANFRRFQAIRQIRSAK